MENENTQPVEVMEQEAPVSTPEESTSSFSFVSDEEVAQMNQPQEQPTQEAAPEVEQPQETFSEPRIAQAVIKHHEVVSLIYQDFSNRLYPENKQGNEKEIEKLIATKIETDVPSPTDKTIFQYFLTFNKVILKTNFFKKNKICAAYRLDPSFLNEVDFP